MNTASLPATRVLLVDDDDTFRRVMASEIGRRGFAVSTAASGKEAIARAAQQDLDVILLDLKLGDMSGIDVLKELRGREPAAAGVVMMTGHGTIDTAIEAIRLGAFDYLEKPCPLDKVEATLRRTHEHLRLVERQRVLEDGYTSPDVGLELLGTSAASERLRQTIARIAPIDSAALVLGETGVGKDLVARLLHARSQRRDKPFVVVDCAALHEDLLQSEIFGHEKGAFTGAARQKHGLFEVANGGTIFLDEVGDTSPEIQAKLLRVLETGRFRRLGGTREIAVDARVISATNRQLRDAIARGHFREDLYFRLAVLTIEVPPLRERPEDIRALVQRFTGTLNARFSLRRRFGEEALREMLRYRWPGNVRELLHVTEQVMVLSSSDAISPEDLPPAIRSEGAPEKALQVCCGDLPLREVERRHVLAVMASASGNRARAAATLEISERNLYRLLKKYGWRDKASEERAESSTPPVPPNASS